MAKAEAVKLRVPADRLTRRKVAIVGFTDHRLEALKLNRDEFEVWGLNELHKQHEVSLFDRWFEVHNRADLDADAEHVAAMGKMDIPVYMQAHYPDIPASVPFPRQQIIDRFGINYFTSSIAWEIAFAILLGAEEIHVYGVDMATSTEYGQQRPCCEYWLARAQGMGIKISVPPTADLLKTVGEYGFGTIGDAFSLKLKERMAWLHTQDNDYLNQLRGMDAKYDEIRGQLTAEYEKKMGQLEREYKEKREGLFAMRNQVYGAILDCEYWVQSWSVPTAGNREFSPDRSKDPRTGIAPAADSKQKDDLGVNPRNRIAEHAAAA